MIYIDRSEVRVPIVLQSEWVRELTYATEQFFKRPVAARRQERFMFDPRGWNAVRTPLVRLDH